MKGSYRHITIVGILIALSMVLLYLNTLIPIANLSIIALMSLITGIVLLETDVKWAWVFFIAVSLLSLLLPVDKLSLLAFYTFFGFYGILKFYAEQFRRNIWGYIIKGVFILAAASANYFLASAFLPKVFQGGVSLYLLLAVALVFLFIYDYIYTLAMVFYENRIMRARR